MEKEQTNFRIDADAKARAYAVLKEIGAKPSDAVNMFMRHIAMFGELPFQPRVPNTETLEVFAKTDAGEDLTFHRSLDALFADDTLQ